MKDIWLSDTSHKVYTIWIGGNQYSNESIIDEELVISSSIENRRQLSFCGCNAAKLEMAMRYLPSENVGKAIIVTAHAELNGQETDEVTLFTGIIYTIEQNGNEDIISNVIAYDIMAAAINIDVADWYNSLTFPMAQGAFRNSLANYMKGYGIEMAEGELPLDTMTIEKTVKPDTLSFKDVLSAIAQLNGCFFYAEETTIAFTILKKNGPVPLYPSDNLYPSDTLYPSDGVDSLKDHIPESEYETLNYQNYDVATIDKVIIREDEDDIGAIFGTGTNAYIIENNFLMYGKTAAGLMSIAEKVYSTVNGLIYTPAKIKCKARPWIKLGDLVRIDSSENVIFTYVLERQFKGVQATIDVFESDQSELRMEQINTVNSSILKLRGKANKLTRDIEHLTSEIYNEDGSSKIEQQAQEISAKVSQQGGNTSFSWRLLADGFELKAGNTVVFRCNKDGITVNGYATAAQINAANAEISKLYANEAALGDLIADKASIAALNATNANVGTLSTNVANLGTAVSNKLTTSELSSAISALSYVAAKSIHCSSYMVNYGGKTWTISPTQLAIGGSQYVLLAARYTG